ncbi:hypothetical protein SDC9_17716 [bioreactor metagenome]|uniref:Uncharacterized protein n=1 Tax=bioreactor metagenome TaxID=1076179 RepID=A0A644TZQ7_9ZZZZ|nr:hypothetical protein [Lentimicrobium sp.]
MAGKKVNSCQTGNSRIIYGFTGLEDYRDFMRLQYDYMSNHNRREVDSINDPGTIRSNAQSGWYGENVTPEEMTGKITEFKDPALLDRIYNKVSDKIPQSIKNKLKEKRMKFNDMGGVFSMDRFMMGMFKKPAFYSVFKKQYVAPAEIYQKGNNYYLKENNTDIEVHEKLTTSNKNVYAYFPQISNENKSIEIVIVAGANANISAEEMLYTGTAGIIISELCDKAGIKVKINVLMGSASQGENHLALIPMKNYNAPIDRNVMALLTSDARIFRHEMFKGIIANYDYFGKEVPWGLGRLITETEAIRIFEDQAIRSKLFAGEKVFFTSGLFSESAVFEKMDIILNNISE